MNTTPQPQPAGYLIGERAGLTRIPVYRTPKGKLTFEPPKAPKTPKAPKADLLADLPNKTGFTPGDRVRRLSDHSQGRYAVKADQTYIVKSARGHAITLKGKGAYTYSSSQFELATPEPTPVKDYAPGGYPSPNFKVGDKVRRTKPFLGFRPERKVVQGEVYTVAGCTAIGGLKLEGKDPAFGYVAESFELVTEPTAPTREEIEAAAQAVYAAFISGADWTVAFRETKQRYRGYAKAALLAARAVAQ